MKYRDLAIAMTLVEGDNYAALQASDYIRLLTGKSSVNLTWACGTNDKIFTWVVESVLYYEKIEDRARLFEMFVLTAVVSATVFYMRSTRANRLISGMSKVEEFFLGHCNHHRPPLCACGETETHQGRFE